MDLEFVRCNEKNNDMFLKMAAEAFNKDHPEWFPDNLGHIFPDKTDLAYEHLTGCNYIALYDGIPAGTIGIYPLDIVTGGKLLKAAGIGTVSVLEQYRGKGIMKFMMQEVMSLVDTSSFDVSWLAGERLRYKNYGYDLSGKTLKVFWDLKSLRKLGTAGSFDITTLGAADADALDQAYGKWENRVLRSKELWERHLKRKNLVWVFDGKNSYYVFERNSPGVILETSGDFNSLSSLLSAHFDKHELQSLELCFPYERSSLIRSFLDLSSYYSVTACNQLRVVKDPELAGRLRYCSELFSDNGADHTDDDIPFYISEIDKV